mmetsp:Transcript_134964/g.234662  ORF Transcript_134964/g.234662 Transcript_134964/m.234662 type:complete len:138 (+) Transcript_134964:57-470(+)
MFQCCVRSAEDRLSTETIIEVDDTDGVEEPQKSVEEKVVEEVKPAPPEEPIKSCKGTIIFLTKGGEEVEIKFTRQPVGISFYNEAPLKVKTASGHAADLGVKVGWLFKTIEGAAVEGKDVPTLKAELVAFAKSLHGN